VGPTTDLETGEEKNLYLWRESTPIPL